MGLFRKLKDIQSAKDGHTLDENEASGKPLDLFEHSDPISLTVGSLEGFSRKDALAYVRGLAERGVVVVAETVTYIGVTEDRANNRFFYEIHEGGPGKSIYEKLTLALQERSQVRLALANGRSVIIEDHHGVVHSLIAPRAEESLELSGEDEEAPRLFEHHAQGVPLEHVWQYLGHQKLTKLYNEGEKMPLFTGLILSIAFFAFVATGATYTLVQGGAFEADAVLTPAKEGHLNVGEDNPAWQLDLAKKEADGRLIKILKKDGKGWSWEIEQ